MPLNLDNPSEFEERQQLIFIIDDNPNNLEVVVNYLKESGFRVGVARNGQSGLRKIFYALPDLILLDVMMPGLSGFEVCRRLKEHDATKNIPVIFMTALASQEDKIKGFQVGAVDYIIKPMNQAEMLARVRTHLRIQNLARRLQEKTAALQQTNLSLQQTNVKLKNINTELQEANQTLAKRTIQMETSAQIGQHITSILHLDKLLLEVVQLIQTKFGYYFVGIWLLTDEEDKVMLHASAGGYNRPFFEQSFFLPMDAPRSIVVTVCRNNQVYLTNNAYNDANHLFVTELPDTHSELVLPLQVQGQVLGALDIHSDIFDAFPTEDVTVFQSMADQIAIAIYNARLFEQNHQRTNELAKAKEGAEQANRAKSEFLANMSHELRSPLNAVLGYAQLMQRDAGLSVEQKENLKIIGRSGRHLLNLINDVLEMSKIEAGRISISEESFDLYNLLDGLESMFQLRAENKGLHLVFERLPTIPQYIKTDAQKLRQILINLLNNAIKFTNREGRVTLRVTYQENNLSFEIEDDGVGIAADEIETLFDPFVQTESGRKSQTGTGLGLSISQQFAHLMGGEITVSSQVGQGTLFKVHLPITVVEANTVKHQPHIKRVIALEPNQSIYRILIVDDIEENRNLLRKLLRSLGFEVQEAKNGQEAINVWEAWSPHLIWMDIRMPVLNGFEATKHIKKTQKGQETIIIALTASVFEEERLSMVTIGCDDFVRKPFQEYEIFEKMGQHLGLSYIYEEEANTSEAKKTISKELSIEALGKLPPRLIDDLYQATILGNFNHLLTIIEQIDSQDSTLAYTLKELLENFDYEEISGFIEQYLETQI